MIHPAVRSPHNTLLTRNLIVITKPLRTSQQTEELMIFEFCPEEEVTKQSNPTVLWSTPKFIFNCNRTGVQIRSIIHRKPIDSSQTPEQFEAPVRIFTHASITR